MDVNSLGDQWIFVRGEYMRQFDWLGEPTKCGRLGHPVNWAQLKVSFVR